VLADIFAKALAEPESGERRVALYRLAHFVNAVTNALEKVK
jgi:hypothetical protein